MNKKSSLIFTSNIVSDLIEEKLGKGTRLSIQDIPSASEAFLASCIFSASQHGTSSRPVITILSAPNYTNRFTSDITTFGIADYQTFPMINQEDEDPQAISARLNISSNFANSNFPESTIIATCIQALMQPIPDTKKTIKLSFPLSINDDVEQEKLIEWIEHAGYTREPEVYERSTYSIKGGIVDIWPPIEQKPIRIEFFGDCIESLRFFDHNTQRSLSRIDSIILSPSKIPKQKTTLLHSIFPKNAIIIWLDINEIEKNAKNFLHTANIDQKHSFDTIRKAIDNRKDITQIFSGDPPPANTFDIGNFFSTTDSYSVDSLTAHKTTDPNIIQIQRKRLFNDLMDKVEKCHAEVHLCMDTESSILNIKSEISNHNLFRIHLAPLSSGFIVNISDEKKIYYISQKDIFGTPKHNPGIFSDYSSTKNTSKIEISSPEDVSQNNDFEPFSLENIEYGEMVVHQEHGIGKYIGMSEMLFDGKRSEVICLEYANKTKLYVPVAKANLISRYSGIKDSAVKPHTLGSKKWNTDKDIVKKSVEDLAARMLYTQAKRSHMLGFAFSRVTPWLSEFEEAFPYTETKGQLECISNVKEDMYSAHPMDRLICGDAGYGKTEVAIRAAFIAAMQGKQVAVLVPTTILAQQHFESFSERMASFPINIALHCRFCTQRQRDKAIEGIEKGTVDIIIGTHGILNPSIKYKDLGLVVIDEEQRFGVKQKEFLKEFRNLVDVLTLSATPIPRTLYLGITGVRDMSLLQTPPQIRVATETKIVRKTDEVVCNAIRAEINRGGQVFYLHNRVMTIDIVKQHLNEIMPDVKVCVAHGQMMPAEIEARVSAFTHGEYDVLLSTTIIENGIDITRANTILIDRADRFGIADLYQLRGRVGRGDVKGYAYLMIPNVGSIDSSAKLRLKALKQHSEFGSGVNLAMRDLSIRGAGNLLGAEQSGHIAAVGFNMYCQLLRKAVAELKGEAAPTFVNVDITLPFLDFSPSEVDEESSAVIPYYYIGNEYLRMSFHRRLAECSSTKELNLLKNEIIDRFGPLPKPLTRLFMLTECRILASERNIERVVYKSNELHMYSDGHLIRSNNNMIPRPSGKNPDQLLSSIRNLIRIAKK